VKKHEKSLRSLYLEFNERCVREIKKLEQKVNHDVKAVEIWIGNEFDRIGIGEFKPFIHFALTSQDINHTAIPMALRDVMLQVYWPTLEEIVIKPLAKMAVDWMGVPMLSRTHGQAAVPTTVGKELLVFVHRLREQVKNFPFSGKFGGAVGNFNAHYAAYPNIDWIKFANEFLADNLGLQRQQWTTQIMNYDPLAEFFQLLFRINTILDDFCRDVWHYISLDYFKQAVFAAEVGSSTMPHKVNPIDFENAEGNLEIANTLLLFFASKV
jgi:adenylosuccinate lyase